jgi:hypothetical protein
MSWKFNTKNVTQTGIQIEGATSYVVQHGGKLKMVIENSMTVEAPAFLLRSQENYEAPIVCPRDICNP